MRTDVARASILVVEDTVEVRELLLELLHEAGYSAVGVEDGLRAVQALSSIQPSLVLLDLSLPGQSGASVLSWMASNPRTKRIPVVVLSASPKVIPPEARAQVKGILDKPFDLDDLLRMIENAVAEPAPEATVAKANPHTSCSPSRRSSG